MIAGRHTCIQPTRTTVRLHATPSFPSEMLICVDLSDKTHRTVHSPDPPRILIPPPSEPATEPGDGQVVTPPFQQ